LSTKTSICNIALTECGEPSVINIDNDQSTRAELCRVNYEVILGSVLSDRQWTFAIERTQLAPLTTVPAFQYSNEFAVPADAARVYWVNNRNEDPRANNTFQWERQQNRILCNANVIYIKYLRKNIPEQQFPANFQLAVAKRLAHQICLPLTKNRKLKEDLYNEYLGVLSDAFATDGTQGKNEVIQSSKLTGARYSSTARIDVV